MAGIQFLSVENVVQIYEETMEADGGLAGVRDYGLLESAVMTPQAQFGGQYLHESVDAMAAAYLYHIAQGHALLDGNKRTAVLAALVFLDNNGFAITASNADIVEIGLTVASGERKKQAAVEWMLRFTNAKWHGADSPVLIPQSAFNAPRETAGRRAAS